MSRWSSFESRAWGALAELGLSSGDTADARTLRQQGLGLIASVVRTGGVSESALLQALAPLADAQVASAQDFAHLAELSDQHLRGVGLSPEWCRTQRLLIANANGQTTLVIADWPTIAQVELLRQVLDFDTVALWFAPSSWFEARPALAGSVSAREGSSVQQLRLLSEEGPVIELVNQMLSTGALRRASDIHVEARDNDFLVRYRIDGAMSQPVVHAKSSFDAVIVRLKILSGLDIAERRLPQDGRIQVRLNGEDYDIRTSVLPASFGEGVVMRLLRSKRQLFSMADLGMQPSDERYFEQLLQLPNGIVLVTGPTGSGKSTTLYTGLSKLNDGMRKIVTVEDPVEYRIEGITQIQANAAIGLDFASSLRGILRHDPDVILLGEIRDKETAEIAVQAALTGHLVLSTLHTNSAVGSITRLIDMGVEPFLVSATVRSLLAQRLVRRLCSACKQVAPPPPEFLRAWLISGLPESELPAQMAQRFSAGCPTCSHSGYYGRLAIYEFAAMNDDVRSALRSNDYAEATLSAAAKVPEWDTSIRLPSLAQDGLRKCAAGETSLAEVLAATEVDGA